jgi:hypothetical protein
MSVRIDCDSCLVRGLACHDCVVTVLLGPPPELGFDQEEQQALEVLADSGLVPPLRMVTPVSGPEVENFALGGGGRVAAVPHWGWCGREWPRTHRVHPRPGWRRGPIFPRVTNLVPPHQRADQAGSGAAPSLEQVPSGETSVPEPGTQVPWGESGGPATDRGGSRW